MLGTIIAGIILLVSGFNQPVWETVKAIGTDSFGFWQWLAVVFPIVCLPGIYFVTQFLTHDKSLASPGCMDNLTGIGLNMIIGRHFMQNPDDLPDNCRLICAGMGCEEAGLRGSVAFAKKHKGDEYMTNCWNINVDSVSDEDYFEVVTADPIQFTKFDKELGDMLYESLSELNLIKKTGRIVNPVGGCDSTSMQRAGAKAITLAAQNPVATNYYHTSNDKSDRLDVKVFEGGLEAVYRTIKKIGAKEAAK
jgi:Predicted aminopeptidases